MDAESSRHTRSCKPNFTGLCFNTAIKQCPVLDCQSGTSAQKSRVILAGDIGGTKCNLAAFHIADGALALHAAETFPSREHTCLEDVIRRFLAKHQFQPEHACFGIAGPVKNGRSLLTNLRWTIDAQAVAKTFALKKVSLMNDLQANAHGIATLGPQDFFTLNAGENVPDANQAVIAAGTGLGEAGLVWNGTRQIAVASEGGNSDFAPRTELDIALLRHLQSKFGQALWEHVLSGQGQVNIYNFLRDTGRGVEEPWLAAEFAANTLPPAAVITNNALAKKSLLCVQALDLFANYYGAETMNLALKFLATGGVFLGGGIAPRIIAKLGDGSFMRGFIGQHRYRDLLMAMPVKVILNDKTALLGAGRFAALEAGAL